MPIEKLSVEPAAGGGDAVGRVVVAILIIDGLPGVRMLLYGFYALAERDQLNIGNATRRAQRVNAGSADLVDGLIVSARVGAADVRDAATALQRADVEVAAL